MISLCEPGPTPAANNLPEDRISMADKDLAQMTGFLTTMFNTDVPSFILLVTAATADNALSESNQLVLKTMWSFTLNESYPRFCLSSN
jgi:hypothetical protein